MPSRKPSIWKSGSTMPSETRARMFAKLHESTLFIGMTEAQLSRAIDAMRLHSYQAMHAIITKGETGDNFFVVESGKCQVEVPERGAAVAYGPGDAFGELALLYNSPRAATVRAQTTVKLWSLSREAYHRAASEARSNAHANLSTCTWEDLEAQFRAACGPDVRLQLPELKALLTRIFGVELNQRDSAGYSVTDHLLEAMDLDGSGDIDIDELRAAWRAWFGAIFRPVRALLVIDVQNDFIDGTLALKNCPAGQDAGVVVPIINQLRRDIHWDAIAISIDSHPQRHCSFHECAAEGDFVAPLHPSQDPEAARRAGVCDTVILTAPDGVSPMRQCLWPRHCVENTWGWECHRDLVVANDDIIVRKGTDSCIDSYSALYDNAKYKQTTMLAELRRRGVTHVYLCGLALDVCVTFTALHCAEEGFVTTVVEDACAGVSNVGIADKKKILLKAGVQLLTSKELGATMNGSSLREALRAAARIRYAKQCVEMLAADDGHGPVRS